MALIEDFTPSTKVLTKPNQPTLLVRWRVAIDCGCCIYVGIRADNQEAATGATRCRDGHALLIQYFQEAMLASIHVPTDRDLVDVVTQMLDAARDRYAESR